MWSTHSLWSLFKIPLYYLSIVLLVAIRTALNLLQFCTAVLHCSFALQFCTAVLRGSTLLYNGYYKNSTVQYTVQYCSFALQFCTAVLRGSKLLYV